MKKRLEENGRKRRLGELLLYMGAVADISHPLHLLIQLNIRELFFPQFFKKYFFTFMHFFRFSVGTFPNSFCVYNSSRC